MEIRKTQQKQTRYTQKFKQPQPPTRVALMLNEVKF